MLVTPRMTLKNTTFALGITLTAVATFATFAASAAPGSNARRFSVIAGFAEETFISGTGKPVRFEAKLDTGATTSAINTDGEHEEYTRQGVAWVRFTVKIAQGPVLKVDARITRFANVKRAGTADERRPVVKLKACVGGVTKIEEFTLSDRSGMDYPILMGRNFLGSDILVDSGRTGLTTGKCAD